MWQQRQTHSPAETSTAGAELAAGLAPGSVVALHGDLGSGKTVFVKGLAAGIGLQVEVTSPTFALIHEYGQPVKLYHLDCYRETSLKRWLDIGVTDFLGSEAITVIEWPEAIDSLLPEETIHLQFSLGASANERIIHRQA
jgi:tRNA threonylcarbamoyladenosine biosynthesis protein TsaE